MIIVYKDRVVSAEKNTIISVRGREVILDGAIESPFDSFPLKFQQEASSFELSSEGDAVFVAGAIRSALDSCTRIQYLSYDKGGEIRSEELL